MKFLVLISVILPQLAYAQNPATVKVNTDSLQITNKQQHLVLKVKKPKFRKRRIGARNNFLIE